MTGADHPKPGDTIDGRYRVEGVIGRSAGSVVLKAASLQFGLELPVALKMLRSREPAVVARFRDQVRAAGRLRSEHACRVLDLGVPARGGPYVVMEYLEGKNLRGVLRARRPTFDDAAFYVVQACRALDEVHAFGIVHHEVRPEKLFLVHRANMEPLLKVLDVGVSQAPTPDLGAATYMSPEQLSASPSVDARTDIWSLGVCLYELTTGALPFDGRSLAEIGAKVMRVGPAPPASLSPGISERIARVIARCLEKEPARRYSSVAALAAALTPN